MAGSGVGYDPLIDGKRYSFGVSGKLFRTNVLMYDRETESLWSQILRKAVTGPMTGTPLKTFPLVETSWKDWKNEHPDTLVLSLKTGYTRPYHQDPYGQDKLDLFGFRGIRGEKALGVIIQGEAKTYPFKQLKKVKKFPMKDQVGNQTVLIYFEKKSTKAWATDEAGKHVESFVTYLWAWKDFYFTDIFKFK